MKFTLITVVLATAAIVTGLILARYGRYSRRETVPVDTGRAVHSALRIAATRARNGIPAPDNFDPGATRIFSVPASPSAPIVRGGGATFHGSDVRLVGLTGAHKGRSFDITAGGIIIGRSDLCNIKLTDPRVSAMHAWIGLVENKVVLRDLQSTNGTYVNTKMDAPIHEVELHMGDMVVLGGHLGDQFHLVTRDKAS